MHHCSIHIKHLIKNHLQIYNICYKTATEYIGNRETFLHETNCIQMHPILLLQVMK